MSVKVIKVTQRLGKANDDGVSFSNRDIMGALLTCYKQVRSQAKAMKAITTGPATIVIIVEQEVILDGD